MHSFFILCKKTTKNKKMFIFYVSLTLYKLFNNCQSENKGVFSESCYFCKVCVARAVWQERAGCVPQVVWPLSPEAVCCLQNLLFYSSLGFLYGSRPKSP